MKRVALIITALLLLCVTNWAQLARYRADFAVSASYFVDSIEIEWHHQQIIVPVAIGGRSYRFLLDTGAGQAVVFDGSPFIADCIDAGRIISHDATGAIDTVRMVKLPPLTLGTTTLTGCQATVQRHITTGHHIDGILGFDLICRGLCMKIDVQSRRLVITDRKKFFDHEDGVELRYRLNFHVPYINVSPFGRYTEAALFDTGSQQFYSMNKQSFDKGEADNSELLLTQVEGRSVGRHAMGHQGIEPRGEVVFLALQRLKLGELWCTDVHCVTTQGGSHIGAALLEKCAVVFNPRRKRVYLQPYEEGRQVSVGNQQLEIAFVAEQGMPVVGLVWEQGEPYRCGFREGDMIVRIDGKPVQSIEQFNRWGFERDHIYTFSVRDRRGFEREVQWARLKFKLKSN